MEKEQIVKQNLELLDEFMKYVFSNSDILEKIPPDAELIILPTNIPELYVYNERTAEKLRKQNKKVVIIKMLKPEPVKPEFVGV